MMETLVLQKSRDSKTQTDSGRLQQWVPTDSAVGKSTVPQPSGFLDGGSQEDEPGEAESSGAKSGRRRQARGLAQVGDSLFTHGRMGRLFLGQIKMAHYLF